jgi:hypothetical protein
MLRTDWSLSAALTCSSWLAASMRRVWSTWMDCSRVSLTCASVSAMLACSEAICPSMLAAVR